MKQNTPEYQQLLQDLIKAGAPTSTAREIKGFKFEYENPIDILVNTAASCRPYKEILIKYLPILKGNELNMVIRALTEKGLVEASHDLLRIFEERSDEDGIDLWAVGNALYVIDDRNQFERILRICRDRRYGLARQMLMTYLGKFKTDESFAVLKECLFDNSVRGHTIEAIGRFGRAEAIELIESLEVEKGKHEFIAKETALRRLRRKIEKNEKG
jgi:HEAT repeat protein